MQFASQYIYICPSLQVSGCFGPIIRRENCVSATLVTCYPVWMTGWYDWAYAPTYQTVIHMWRLTNINILRKKLHTKLVYLKDSNKWLVLIKQLNCLRYSGGWCRISGKLPASIFREVTDRKFLWNDGPCLLKCKAPHYRKISRLWEINIWHSVLIFLTNTAEKSLDAAFQLLNMNAKWLLCHSV